MTRERLMVLKLIEDKKITTDEAVKLLNAMKKGNSSNNNVNKESFQKMSKSVGDFTKDMGDKCSELFENAEPTIKNVKKTVSTNVSSILSDLSKVLNQNSFEANNANTANNDNDDIIDVEIVPSSKYDEVIKNVY